MKKKRTESDEPPYMVFKFCGKSPCTGDCGWFYGPGYEDESRRGKKVPTR